MTHEDCEVIVSRIIESQHWKRMGFDSLNALLSFAAERQGYRHRKCTHRRAGGRDTWIKYTSSIGAIMEICTRCDLTRYPGDNSEPIDWRLRFLAEKIVRQVYSRWWKRLLSDPVDITQEIYKVLKREISV